MYGAEFQNGQVLDLKFHGRQQEGTGIVMDSDPADRVQATFGSRVLGGCQCLVASFTKETAQATWKLNWGRVSKNGAKVWSGLVLVIFSSQLEDRSAEALRKQWMNR